MKKDIRIVFMGTPDFAVTILKSLIKNKYNIVGVITAPDKPAGRGRKLHESAIKKYASSKKLHIMQPKNLKDDTFNEELKSLNPDLQIVVAFRMLPKVVWQLPKYGTFNLHASLLPNYRGAAPINWAIINGETKTGVSTFFIDEKIDTGEMILQKEVAISKNETAGTLHDKLMTIGSDLVIKTVNLIKKGNLKTTPQLENTNIKTAYKLNNQNCKIDWNESLDNINNKIRGLNPYPGAWTELINGKDKLRVKIYIAKKEVANHKLNIGHIITSKNELKIAVKKGYIIISELQLPAKRKMTAKDLLNGYTFNNNSKML
jgi:methionyl-tRNA formyltransferase